MSRKSKLVSVSCALALGLGTTTSAQAAAPQIKVFDNRPSSSSARSSAHKAAERSHALGAEGKRLAAKAETLSKEPDFGLAGGVSQSTLDAIAACESGGDPTAVDSSRHLLRPVPVRHGHLGLGRRQRQPRRRLARGAELPRVAAVRARRLQPLARLRRLPSLRLQVRGAHPDADGIWVSVDDFVLVQGMRDTRGALERWNAHPWPVLRAWFGGALIVASALLFSVWVIASLSTPDLSQLRIPGVTDDANLGDIGHILFRNSLVLALHAFACVAGFIAGSSLRAIGRAPQRALEARAREGAPDRVRHGWRS